MYTQFMKDTTLGQAAYRKVVCDAQTEIFDGLASAYQFPSWFSTSGRSLPLGSNSRSLQIAAAARNAANAAASGPVAPVLPAALVNPTPANVAALTGVPVVPIAPVQKRAYVRLQAGKVTQMPLNYNYGKQANVILPRDLGLVWNTLFAGDWSGENQQKLHRYPYGHPLLRTLSNFHFYTTLAKSLVYGPIRHHDIGSKWHNVRPILDGNSANGVELVAWRPRLSEYDVAYIAAHSVPDRTEVIHECFDA